MFSKYPYIGDFEFDITSTCNSMCPSCARTTYDTNTGLLSTNPILPKNMHMDLAVLENISKSPLITSDTEIRLAGAFSDPLMHPQLLEIVEEIYRLMPYVQIRIATNGGARSADYVEKVSIAMSKFENSWFDFSIDGLEDTNELYRYNVNFERAFENMKAARKVNKNVRWQVLKFPWNEHQLNTIKRRAKEHALKYYQRVARDEDFNGNDYSAVRDGRVTSKPSTVFEFTHTDTLLADPKPDRINPLCYKQYSAFVGFDNRLYVCCSHFTDKYSRTAHLFNEHMDQDSDWNDLTKHSFDDIIKHPYWDKLAKSIDTNNPYNFCATHCGENNT